LIRSAFGQGSVPAIAPSEAAAEVKAGTAIIIDVREPSEWETGVAAPAYLLPLSDLRSARKKWAHVLKDAKSKKIILYCRSGGRSGQAAAILTKEGFTVANAGGFDDWLSARLPLRAPADPAGNE
jgi:rhodanese-related sulfurtransferase